MTDCEAIQRQREYSLFGNLARKGGCIDMFNLFHHKERQSGFLGLFFFFFYLQVLS